MTDTNDLTPREELQKAIETELNKDPYIVQPHFNDSDNDPTDNPAFPIIEYLQEQIQKEEKNKEYWAVSHTFTAQKLHNNAVQRISVLKDVLDFIEETFNP